VRAQAYDPLHGRKAQYPPLQLQPGLARQWRAACIALAALRVDDAIEAAILKVVEPSAIAAAIEAACSKKRRVATRFRDALVRDLEAMRYTADRAFRQYDATDPANRLVAAELELALETGH